jgi:histidinol-phosphatase (PHP family)
MDYIGIADHSPYFYSDEDQLYPGIAMGKSELANYVEESAGVKEKV